MTRQERRVQLRALLTSPCGREELRAILREHDGSGHGERLPVGSGSSR
jgi:hypothetical protein